MPRLLEESSSLPEVFYALPEQSISDICSPSAFPVECILRGRLPVYTTSEIEMNGHSNKKKTHSSLTKSGTGNCQLSKPKCITASVYPHITQLLRLAVSPSKTLLLAEPRIPSSSSPGDFRSSKTPAIPRSFNPSFSTANISFLMRSETSWKSSCASWCSREENNGLRLVPGIGVERTLIIS